MRQRSCLHPGTGCIGECCKGCTRSCCVPVTAGFDNVAVVDEESSPPVVVVRYGSVPQAEWYLGYLAKHGGTALRAKVERGGYGIDAGEAVQ